MTPKRWLAIALLIPFTVVTLIALREVGYLGIIEYHLPSPAGWQVFFDLVIALVLFCGWMISDAARHGRKVWPYLLITLFAGSFGPLLYLLMGARETDPVTHTA